MRATPAPLLNRTDLSTAAPDTIHQRPTWAVDRLSSVFTPRILESRQERLRTGRHPRIARRGRSRHEDLEVVTGHYRGAHAGGAAKSGFTCYLSIGCKARRFAPPSHARGLQAVDDVGDQA